MKIKVRACLIHVACTPVKYPLECSGQTKNKFLSMDSCVIFSICSLNYRGSISTPHTHEFQKQGTKIEQCQLHIKKKTNLKLTGTFSIGALLYFIPDAKLLILSQKSPYPCPLGWDRLQLAKIPLEDEVKAVLNPEILPFVCCLCYLFFFQARTSQIVLTF